MASYNRVILMGNLTRDPELSWTSGSNGPSVPVAKMGLAVSEKYKNRSGEMTESVCFVDVVVWRRQAETCAEYLSKGSPVLVEGRLQFDQWTTQQGEKRSKLRVKADRVQFLGSPKGTSFKESSAPPARPAEGPPSPADVPSAEPPTRPAEGPPSPADVPSAEPPTGDDDNLPF